MSAHTQAMKRHSAGRSFLTLAEIAGRTPWYASRAWQFRKDAIARRVAKRVERATMRRLEREDLARGITPEMARLRSIEREKVAHPERLSFFVRIWRWLTKPFRKQIV